MIEDIVVGSEDPVRQPIIAQELPDVFDGVQLRAFGRQREERDVERHDELVRQMPAGLIDQHDRVSARRHGGRDLRQVQGHHRGVAPGQYQSRSLTFLGADGAEDVGRSGALIARRRRPRAAQCPAPGDLVLLPDPSLVAEPDAVDGS